MKKLLKLLLIAGVIASMVIGCNSQGNALKDNGGKGISTEERQRMDLYIIVMKAAFQEGNGGEEFVAVKLDSLDGLSDKAKAEVLKELTCLSPYVYRFEDVMYDNSKFELDDQGRLRRSINGSLLWVEVEEYSNSKSTITGVSWHGNLAAVYPTYEATFKNEMWQLELIMMAIS